MALSAIVALSLTPALCALLLKPHDKDEVKGPIGKFIHKFNVWFANTLSKYVKNVEKCTSCKNLNGSFADYGYFIGLGS